MTINDRCNSKHIIHGFSGMCFGQLQERCIESRRHAAELLLQPALSPVKERPGVNEHTPQPTSAYPSRCVSTVVGRPDCPPRTQFTVVLLLSLCLGICTNLLEGACAPRTFPSRNVYRNLWNSAPPVSANSTACWLISSQYLPLPSTWMSNNAKTPSELPQPLRSIATN